MPKCATCHRDYDDEYDSCPRCAGKGGTADRLQTCGCVFLILLGLPVLLLLVYAAT